MHILPTDRRSVVSILNFPRLVNKKIVAKLHFRLRRNHFYYDVTGVCFNTFVGISEIFSNNTGMASFGFYPQVYGMKRNILTFLFPFLLCVLAACSSTVLDSSPAVMPYTSPHFTIYYDTLLLSPGQIERLAWRNEHNLNRVNAYLHTSFSDRISLVISDSEVDDEAAHAHRYNEINSSLDYALVSTGHEIAHIVTFTEWGYSSNRFLLEGIAVAAQNYEHSNALLEYARHYPADRARLGIDTIREVVFEGINSDEFESSLFHYNIAGSFVHYCIDTYTFNTFKLLYLKTVTGYEISESLLEYYLSTDLQSLIDEYIETLERLSQ